MEYAENSLHVPCLKNVGRFHILIIAFFYLSGTKRTNLRKDMKIESLRYLSYTMYLAFVPYRRMQGQPWRAGMSSIFRDLSKQDHILQTTDLRN